MFRFCTYLILLVATAVLMTGCDPYSECYRYFGERSLISEYIHWNQPNKMVMACIVGADKVAPVVKHQGTVEEECQKLYGVSEKTNGGDNSNEDITQKVSASLDETGACVAGAKAMIEYPIFEAEHQVDVFGKYGDARAIAFCEWLRGKYGLNPNLPCY